MVRVQGKLIILITVAMGIMSLRSFSEKESQRQSSLKSVEEYWQETGLKTNDIEDILQTEQCHSSERYFLSCANAVVTLAQRFGKQVGIDGKISILNTQDATVDESEKSLLAPWKEAYSSYRNQKRHLNFIAIFRSLMTSAESKSKDAFYVGLAFNAFLSIFKDPHTYLTPMKYYQEVVSQPDSKSLSLGITLGRNEGGLILRKIAPHSIADEVGLKRGDKILKINSNIVNNMNLSQVLDILRADISQEISLLIGRKDKVHEFTLKRREQVNDAVVYSILPDKKNVGLLTINRFSHKSCEIAKEALQKLNESKANAVIIDLRDNPGGLVDEAACIASLFIGPKKMFVLKYLDENKDNEIFYGEEDQIYDQSVAVLINSATASSAELLAGILKDYGRAVVVGEKSFGKGSFQEGDVWFRNKRLALFQTQGLFYLPSGKSPQATGIEPDVVVKSSRIFNDRESDLYIFPLQAKEFTPWVVENKKTSNSTVGLALKAMTLFQD